jgi:cytoskeletal protein RodZ
MAKFSLFVAVTIAFLVGMNSLPSLVYAQTDEEAAQPSEAPQTDNAEQPDQTATPDEQGDETQSESTDEPENQGDEQSPQEQE